MTDNFRHAGSISHGTMRAEDLIPAFTSVLKDLDPKLEEKIGREYRRVYKALDHPENRSEWGSVYLPAALDDDAGWLMESLFDALNDCAPSGYSFGAHEGDGSDYGFWAYDDDDDENGEDQS